MSSSLRIGLEAVSANAAGAMILLADQPMITSDVIDMLATFFMQDSSRIAAAAVRGRRTTPVIFPADLFQELMDARGDVGGREVLDRRGQRVSLFEVGPWYDDSDLDAPEDLEMIRLKITRPEPDLA
jgi:molybdenum cofactor cytidylyltransferase